MSKNIDLSSLCSGILFCLVLAALIVSCLAYTKKGGEYYGEYKPQLVHGTWEQMKGLYELDPQYPNCAHAQS